MNSNDHKTSDRHCVFRAAGSLFAVSAVSVSEIAERPALVSVPDAPAALAGMCHFRSEFLPVLNLAHFTSTLQPQRRDDAFILVLTGHEGNWAILIERGLALEALEVAYAADGGASQVLVGTATYRDDVVQVLEAELLYQRASAMLEQDWRPLFQNEQGPR